MELQLQLQFQLIKQDITLLLYFIYFFKLFTGFKDFLNDYKSFFKNSNQNLFKAQDINKLG